MQRHHSPTSQHAGAAPPPSSIETTAHIQSSTASQELDFLARGCHLRCAIDPDGEIVAFSNETDSFSQSFSTNTAEKLAIVHGARVNCVSINRGVVATSSLGGSCGVQSLGNPRWKCAKRDGFSLASSCALSEGGTVMTIAFVNEQRWNSQILNFQLDCDRIISTWTLDSWVSNVSISPNARFVLAATSTYLPDRQRKDSFQVFGADDGALHCSTDFSFGKAGIFGCSSDATGDSVILADAQSLRVWHVSKPGTPLHHLPSYTAQNGAPRGESLHLGSCAMSQDGSRAVAAITGNCFGVWDTTRLSRIATLIGHMAAPCACAVSSDGMSIFTVAADFKVCKWDMPAEGAVPRTEESASVLEKALGTALSDDNVVDEEFVLEHIRAENVNTVSDLLAGHNLILLSIRAGAITRESIQNFGGSSWYLLDNLYLPASKLTMESAVMIDAIIHHADAIGIIKNGYALKVAREIRTDMKKGMEGVSETIETLAERVGVIEQRVGALEDRTSVLEGNVEGLRAAVGNLSLNQQQLQEAVSGLSGSLSHLHQTLIKRDRRMQRVQVARCMLSFIPLVGKAIGDVAYTATEVLMHLTMDDLVPPGVDFTKAAVAGMASVDLSNIQVARYAFSNQMLAKLEEPARRAVLSAIRGSGFKGPDELGEMLQGEISVIGKDEPSMALLDIGSSMWLTTGGEARASTSSGDAQGLDEHARKYFQYLTHSSESGTLPLETAKKEVNNLLVKNELSEVDLNSLEDLFFDLADDDAEEVTEEVFVGMFLTVQTKQYDRSQMDHLIKDCAERFRRRAGPSKSLTLRFSARLICNLCKEMVEKGYVEAATSMDMKSVTNQLQAFDVDASDSIEEDEFLAAVKALLHHQ